MEYSFIALLFRQKYIRRWGLMRNTHDENLSEHCAETALVAHALASIGNHIYNKGFDTGRAVLLALYHDAPEVLTGDLPTPIKYYNDQMKLSYSQIEKNASDMLLSTVPDEIFTDYKNIFSLGGEDDGRLSVLVHAADKLCAYIKCIEEEKSGNSEFLQAKISLEKILKNYDCPELRWFEKYLLPAFSKSLDETAILQ